jgi:hypothetical protein
MRKFIFLQRVKILNVLYPGEGCTRERGGEECTRERGGEPGEGRSAPGKGGTGEAIDLCQPRL